MDVTDSAGALTLRYVVDAGWERCPDLHRYADAAGVAVDDDGRVYVLTRGPAQVLVYEPNGSFCAAWGRGMFTERAHGITLGPDNDLYCVDDAGHCVMVFGRDGTFRRYIGPSGVPSDTGYDGQNADTVSRGGGPYNRPTNVAVAPDGTIFVADGYGNCQVHRFRADGTLERSWGRPGSGPGELRLVHGIAVLPDMRVLVADRENDRIQVYDADGQHLDTWVDVQRPTDLAYDAVRGRLIVSELGWQPGQRSFVHGFHEEALPPRLSVMDLQGRPLARLAGGGDPCEPGNLIAPHGVTVDNDGNIFVAEVAWTIGVSKGLVPAGCHTLQRYVRDA